MVRLKRLTLAAGPRAPRLSRSGFLDDEGESFERRVTRALSFEEEPSRADDGSLSRSCVRTGFAGAALFALSLIVLFFTAPLAVHRTVESVLQILHI
jgi:hypothetical protein